MLQLKTGELPKIDFGSSTVYMSFDRFLLTVESRDLSQADKILIRVSFFPKLSDGYFWMIKFAVIPKKSYLALGNFAKLVFWSISSFKNLQA